MLRTLACRAALRLAVREARLSRALPWGNDPQRTINSHPSAFCSLRASSRRDQTLRALHISRATSFHVSAKVDREFQQKAPAALHPGGWAGERRKVLTGPSLNLPSPLCSSFVFPLATPLYCAEPYLLDVSGMSCGGCVSNVKRVLLTQPGISGVGVNLVMNMASIDTTTIENARAAADALTRAGYPTKLRKGEDNPILDIAQLESQFEVENRY